MADLVEVKDVEAQLLCSLTDQQAQFVPALLEQATSQLRAKRRNIDDRIELWGTDPNHPDALDPSLVAIMLAAVVKRLLVNPRGLWSSAETDGDYSISETYPGQRAGNAESSPGELTITAADLAKIDRPSGPRRSIRVASPAYPARLR